ncbi:helix-turn-helix transcriptional regulator [Rasiella rasia]|uniref:Helix-turn-helix transcriptional regulator n=1 Tax=Rasiella rasia TaxID=2744027 RepID=A0A6G6GM67_9FLAO|nr:AraC family transcriptional regulator [Rasiella rasia]QIE59675.1 helix-turn-helix transcriptional regulator [Rasiella rasia]
MIKTPVLKKLNPGFGSSFMVRQHADNREIKNALWHFHPEVELVYISEGRGKCHIGNYFSYFNHSQLLLIGSNLPHHGFVDRLTARGKETVIQFHPDFLEGLSVKIPEFSAVSNLLERAKKGIVFGENTKKSIGAKIELLAEKEGFSRLLIFLEILNDLAVSEDYLLLNVDGFVFETSHKDSVKIDIVYKYMHKNFQKEIQLADVADKVSMTVPSFCRYFKKSTNKTFTEVLNEYRVVHATKLLTESQLSVTDICFECGFNSFSHFNKKFKLITGKTALQYRKGIKLIISE